MSPKRVTRAFYFDKVSEAYGLDEVEQALIADVDRAMNALWPHPTLSPPPALVNLFISVAQLIEWQARTPRGRSRIRQRVLKVIAARWEHHPDSDDLLKNSHAQKVVPGLFAELLQEEAAELERDLTVDDGAQLADDVEAWLAAGDD